MTNTIEHPPAREAQALTTPFNRPPRILRRLPAAEVEVPGPPQRPAQHTSAGLLAIGIPLATSLIYLVMALLRGSQGTQGNLLFALPLVMISFLSAGAAHATYRRQRQARADAERAYTESYAAALGRTRQQLKQFEAQQRSIYLRNDPDLDQLTAIAQGHPGAGGLRQPDPRLWERRPGDDDFLCLRAGRGDQPTSVIIKPPGVDAYTQDVEVALRLAEEFQVVRDVPVSVPLRAVGDLGIAGPSGRALDLLRALLWQVAIHHAPDDVRIAALWESEFDPSWEWLRWLPHTRSLDGDLSYRLLARYDRNPEDLRQVLGSIAKELKQRQNGDESANQSARRRPHLIIVISSYQRHVADQPFLADLLTASALGVSAICLEPAVRDIPSSCGGYIDLTGNHPGIATLARTGAAGGLARLCPDGVDSHASNQLSHLLAPIALNEAESEGELPRMVSLLSLLSIEDARSYAPQQRWHSLPSDSWHPVPIGMQSAAAPLLINLNEGAHAAHGIIAGATGAGKSELLLSFLMALAIAHSPDRLNFLLVDFKGGATFRDLVDLPHTAGFVTDLSGFLAERALIAMNSELDRRKRYLNEHGVPNIRSYRAAGLDGPGQHLPNLLIVIDEFDEMIRDYPEFQVELIRVAKQGRSLGVHLLFATQQPSLVKEGLTNNLSYWMALRVNALEDSKAMVGTPDAANLGTNTPGRGYFRDKNSGVRCFQSAMITAAYQPSLASGLLSHEVDVTGRHRLLTDEHHQEREVRRALAQLFDAVGSGSNKGACSEAIEQAARSIDAVLQGPLETEPASDQPGFDRQAGIRELLQNMLVTTDELHLDLDSAPSSQDEVIERRLGDLANTLIERLRGKPKPTTEIRLIVERMIAAEGAQYAAAAYPIWTEPLPPILSLRPLLLDRKRDAWLNVPIGAVDQPEHAQRRPLLYNLLDGNLVALGIAGSAKTTLLQTVLIGLAATHAPSQLWCYLIDSAGSALGLQEGGISYCHMLPTPCPRATTCEPNG